MVLIWSIAVILTFYLIQPFLFWLISLLRKYPERVSGSPPFYSCVITAYRQLDQVDLLINSILQTGYTSLEILVIADRADPNILKSNQPPVKVIVPESPLDSKLKSMELGLHNASDNSKGIVVFDPDNLTAADFFRNLSDYVRAGFSLVQGIRIAKNQDTDIARAASLGEYYHNFCDRLIQFKAGGSPSISGSAYFMNISFATRFFKSETYRKRKEHVILGEDKLIQSYAALNGERIAFETRAITYDEKVRTPGQAQNQRSRWINSYFENLPMAFRLILKGITNWNALLMGLSSSRPPMLILTSLSFIIAVVVWFLNPVITMVLGAGLLIFILNFLIAVRKSPHAKKVSLWSVPGFVVNQFVAIIKSRRQRKEFVVTEKDQSVTIDDLK